MMKKRSMEGVRRLVHSGFSVVGWTLMGLLILACVASSVLVVVWSPWPVGTTFAAVIALSVLYEWSKRGTKMNEKRSLEVNCG